MAITTYAGMMNGLIQPVFVTKAINTDTTAATYLTLNTWNSTNNAGTFSTATAGAVLSSTSAQVAGQLLHVNPATGNSYVAVLKALITTGSRGSLVYLCDRLWDSGGYSSTITTAQTVNSPTWPARDIAGSTNGDGVMIMFEVRSVSLGAAPSASMSISYTNQAGTAGRTGTIVLPSTVSQSVNNVYFFGLQSGDTGVRSVQSLTLSSSLVSGTWGLSAVRVLALMPVSANKKAYKEDGFTLGLPRLWDGSVPFILLSGNGNGTKTQITYNETMG